MKHVIVSTMAILLIGAAVDGATIVAYDTVNGASVSPGLEGTGVTAGDLVRGLGLSETSGFNFNSRGWTQGGDEATALASGDYLEWSFTSIDAYDLTGLDIAYDRSPTGAMAISILLSLNGGAFNRIFQDNSISTSGETNNIGLAGGNVTSAVFRLAGWNSTNPVGTFDIETGEVGPNSDFGLVVSGDRSPATQVPLPAGLPLALIGLVAVAIARRRRPGISR